MTISYRSRKKEDHRNGRLRFFQRTSGPATCENAKLALRSAKAIMITSRSKMWNRSIIAGILILICLAISFFTMFEEKRMFQDFTTWNSTTSSVVSADEEEEQHGAAGTCGDEDASTITTTGNGAEPVVTNAGIDDTSNSNHGCPNNLVFVQDKMWKLHFSACCSGKLTLRFMPWWRARQATSRSLIHSLITWSNRGLSNGITA